LFFLTCCRDFYNTDALEMTILVCLSAKDTLKSKEAVIEYAQFLKSFRSTLKATLKVVQNKNQEPNIEALVSSYSCFTLYSVFL